VVNVIPPAPSRDDDYFWAAARQGRLVARRCRGCGFLQHPPAPMCPRCQSTDFDVEELCGEGAVHSWIVSRHPSMPDDAGRIVALIDLKEGIRMVSNIAAPPTTPIHNGMAVTVSFADFDGVTLPQFVPCGKDA
jgi:hypothetical protein